MKNLSFGKIAILSTIVGGSLISETGSAQNVDWISVYQHPDARVNMGLFLQRDSGGNLFVGGQIKRDAAITVDVLVQKYNSVGGLLWNFWIDSDYDIATGMGLDSSSNVVVSGILDDSAAPDPSKHRATVLSLDSAGAYRYGFWLTNGRNAGVAVEPGGSFVTVGSDVAPKSGRLRKYNSAGTSLWTKVYSLPAYDVVDGVGVSEDTAGNIYALMNAHRIDDGSWEMKTIKYSPAGVRLWVNSIASGRWNTGVKILARPSGGCVVIGSSTVEGTFDGNDYLTASIDTDGVTQWKKFWDSSDHMGDFPQNMALDSAGKVTVTGVSFLPDSLRTVFTIVYGLNGAKVWGSRYKSINGAAGTCCAMAADGSIYVGGIAGRGTPLKTSSLVLKYTAAGALVWNHRYFTISQGSAEINSMVTDGSSNAIVVGTTDTVFNNSNAILLFSIH